MSASTKTRSVTPPRPLLVWTLLLTICGLPTSALAQETGDGGPIDSFENNGLDAAEDGDGGEAEEAEDRDGGPADEAESGDGGVADGAESGDGGVAATGDGGPAGGAEDGDGGVAATGDGGVAGGAEDGDGGVAGGVESGETGEGGTEGEGELGRRFELDAELLTMVTYLNDGDFDRTEPFYDAEGQHVGFVATMLRAGVTWNATSWLRIRYAAEIGLNIWSRNDVEEINPTADDTFLLLHREIWASAELPNRRLSFKVGYGYAAEPTELFIGHWMGHAEVGVRLTENWMLDVQAGILPDATYEGWDAIENNFSHDVWTVGFDFHGSLASDRVQLHLGAMELIDTREVDRLTNITAPFVRVEIAAGAVRLGLEAMVQIGSHQQGTLERESQLHVAWAVGHDGRLRLGDFSLDWDLLFLSPDGSDEGSDLNTGFLYSGRSRSPTLWLTENELQDLLSNIDERVGTEQGSHFHMRPGLALMDVRLAYELFDFFEPGLILGLATVLEPDNALDGVVVGMETSLDLRFFWRELIEAHIIGTVLVPGKAGGAVLNRIDRDATDVIFGLLATLAVRY